MMLDYYAHKAKNVLLTRFAGALSNRRTGPGLVCGSIGDFRFARRFVFFFADEQLVHLGDQLFHQPLLNLWRDGYDLSVATGRAMAPYFGGQGIALMPQSCYKSVRGAVIITKNDLAHAVARLFPSGNYFVGVNYHLVEDDGPICAALARAVYCALAPLELELPALPPVGSPVFQPHVPGALQVERSGDDWMDALKRDGESRYLAFNDFVSSNHFAASRRMGVIADVAARKRAEGYKVVYVGSRSEQQRKPTPPPFVDLDLRGRFEPLGLYKLFSLNNVVGAISFDTFVMHVASAHRKDLYVVRKSTAYPASYRRKYVPMYPGADEIVKAYV